MRNRVTKPCAVIRNMGAHACSCLRQPPMLHIAFHKLAGGCANKMLPHQSGAGGRKGHAILQLISEPISPTGLIKTCAGTHAAGKCLIQQPAIEHDIHAAIRRFNLNRPTNTVPLLFDLIQNGVQINRPVMGNYSSGFSLVFCFS